MAASVRIPTVMRPLTGGASVVDADGTTLGEVITDLTVRFEGLGERILDDEGGLRQFVNVFVGDEDVRYLGGLETPVPDGIEISIIPAVAGG